MWPNSRVWVRCELTGGVADPVKVHTEEGVDLLVIGNLGLVEWPDGTCQLAVKVKYVGPVGKLHRVRFTRGVTPLVAEVVPDAPVPGVALGVAA